MVADCQNSNSSKFQISFSDEGLVPDRPIFGRVRESCFAVLSRINEAGRPSGVPCSNVVILESGCLPNVQKRPVTALQKRPVIRIEDDETRSIKSALHVL